MTSLGLKIVAIMKIIEIDSTSEVLHNHSEIDRLRSQILDGAVVIQRESFDPVFVQSLVGYLADVGRCSLPNYQSIEFGAPNFHRLNKSDQRSHVKGCFHQFAFYPWNQDVFDLFERTRVLFQFKNALSNNDPNKYLGTSGEDGIVTRLAFQFYPSGMGYLNLHQDPVGSHQLTVPTMSLTQKGVDFQSGGAYIDDAGGNRHNLDDIMGPGDVVYFDARLKHGVELIDPESDTPWTEFRGRWSLLIATNKLATNTNVPDAVDYGA